MEQAIESEDTTARDALERSISARLALLSHDELRVFDVQLERMLKIGRANYSPLQLARDTRDWSTEVSDEMSDALFYMCARTVADNDRRREQLRFDAAAELAHLTAGAEANKHFGSLPNISSTYDLRETDGALLAVHEILPASFEEEVTKERVVLKLPFDVGDIEEVA